MSTIDKAAQVIADTIETEGGNIALHLDLATMTDAIAQDLADAGLLKPELPVAVRAWADDDAPWLWKVSEIQNSLAVTLDTGYRQPVISVEDFNQEFKRLTTAEARDLALALMAAAQHAEQEQA